MPNMRRSVFQWRFHSSGLRSSIVVFSQRIFFIRMAGIGRNLQWAGKGRRIIDGYLKIGK